MEAVEGVGVGVDVSAAAGVGVGIDVVAVSVSYVAVSSDADTGVLITPQVPNTTGSVSAMRAASRSGVTYPSDVT